MSFSLNGLRSANDDNIPTEPVEPIDFTTTAIRRNLSLENGLICKEIRVENKDLTNDCTLRLHSRNGAALRVPPNSDRTVKGVWFSEFHVEPDGTTGS
jgi:hypothetical protein